MDAAGISCYSTPSKQDFVRIRRKVRAHLAEGGSEGRLPHANQLWMLVGFALFEELLRLAECIEVFPQSTVQAIGAGQTHKFKREGLEAQMAAAARSTGWSSVPEFESALAASAYGPSHDRLDAYLSAWVGSLDQSDRVALGTPPDDVIWIPRVSDSAKADLVRSARAPARLDEKLPIDDEAATDFPLSARFHKALGLASELHTGQYRKGTSIPYVAHLLGVASLALDYGASEDEAIAALLHDAVEDQGGERTAKLIARKFGQDVADIVDGCSDTDVEPKPPWRARKVTYLEHLRDASPSVRFVSACDKLHNLRAILTDYKSEGERLWSRFNGGKGREPLVLPVARQGVRAGLNTGARSRPRLAGDSQRTGATCGARVGRLDPHVNALRPAPFAELKVCQKCRPRKWFLAGANVYGVGHEAREFLEPGSKDIPAHTALPGRKLLSFIPLARAEGAPGSDAGPQPILIPKDSYLVHRHQPLQLF